jgi:hypothetical protein
MPSSNKIKTDITFSSQVTTISSTDGKSDYQESVKSETIQTTTTTYLTFESTNQQIDYNETLKTTVFKADKMDYNESVTTEVFKAGKMDYNETVKSEIFTTEVEKSTVQNNSNLITMIATSTSPSSNEISFKTKLANTQTENNVPHTLFIGLTQTTLTTLQENSETSDYESESSTLVFLSSESVRSKTGTNPIVTDGNNVTFLYTNSENSNLTKAGNETKKNENVTYIPEFIGNVEGVKDEEACNQLHCYLRRRYYILNT